MNPPCDCGSSCKECAECEKPACECYCKSFDHEEDDIEYSFKDDDYEDEW